MELRAKGEQGRKQKELIFCGRHGRRYDRGPGSLIHFLGFDVELLQEIGEAAHGEDGCEAAGGAWSKDVAVDEPGCDPGAETEWAGEQFANSTAQAATLGAFFYFPGAAFPFHFREWCAKRARHFVLGDDPAQFLGGESKEREIFRVNPFGQWFARTFAREQSGGDQAVERGNERGVIACWYFAARSGPARWFAMTFFPLFTLNCFVS